MRMVSASNQEWLWEETAHAVRQNRPLAEIFRELSQSTSSHKCRLLTLRLAREIESGKSFSAAVADLDGTFQPGTAAAIEAGEKSGRLAETLDALAENAIAATRIGGLVLDAVAYPLVIAFVATAILIFLRIQIIPSFQQIYMELDVELPAITKFLPVYSLVAIGFLVVPAFILLLFFALPSIRLTGWEVVDAVRLYFPLLGGVTRRLALARWCNTMSALITAGVPEGKAIRMAGESAGNALIANESRRTAALVDSGMPLGEAMEARKFFPATLTWMVRAASSTGSHAYLWSATRDIYRDQAERWSLVTSVVLRILFIVLAFAVVGVTIQALFLPLVRLMNSLGG
jgi:type IV pilus assembly protein PilC